MTKWSSKALADLDEILANLYPLATDARRIAAKAGLKISLIDFEGSSINRWFNILEHANGRSKVADVVAASLEEFPEDESLKQALDGAPPPRVRGPEAKDWRGTERPDQLEALIGTKSTLVPISYLQVGLERSRSVVRVKHPDGSSGTGFVSAGSLLVTNHHVLPTEEIAKKAIVQFNYQQTAAGLDDRMEEAHLLPDDYFRTSLENDWTAVRVGGDAPSRWGMLTLAKTLVRPGAPVNIIQHPGGGPKQVSLYANVVVFADDGRVQYLTDTLPGSSGSPVFDASWNIVALHHSGGWLKEPNARSKSTYLRNEGIAIARIVDGLA